MAVRLVVDPTPQKTDPHGVLVRCEIDEELANLAGVQPAVLERLGKVIVFAGPNGGGKTRYMGLVYRYAHDAITRHTIVRGNQQTATQLPPADENDPRAATFDRTIQEQIASPAFRNLEVQEGAPVPQIVRLSYPQTEPRNEDITNVTALDLETKATAVRSGDFAVSYVGMHAYVAAHAKALWEGQHPDLAANNELRRRAERAEKFNAGF